ISAKKRDIEMEYRRMGEAYFANYTAAEKAAVDTLLDPHCENIIFLKKEIQELEQKIKAVNNEKTCECGKVVPRDTKFCPSCGHKFGEETILQEEEGAAETAECAACHTPMEPDAKFCPSCGEPSAKDSEPS
ncbi:zinc ribbon domain-containing protein, partial [Cutibacterium acnes]